MAPLIASFTFPHVSSIAGKNSSCGLRPSAKLRPFHEAPVFRCVTCRATVTVAKGWRLADSSFFFVSFSACRGRTLSCLQVFSDEPSRGAFEAFGPHKAGNRDDRFLWKGLPSGQAAGRAEHYNAVPQATAPNTPCQTRGLLTLPWPCRQSSAIYGVRP